MSFSKVCIIGVGLIGGAIGLAIRRILDVPVIGAFRRQSSLDAALSIGAVTEGHLDLSEAVDGCDLVILGVSVSKVVPLTSEALSSLAKDAIIVDVGSTKAKIVEEMSDAVSERSDISFLGCHPLAGSEKRGVANAQEVDLKEAMCVLTPTDDTPDDLVSRVSDFWESIGMQTAVMSPENHDIVLAQVSHVPHFVSSALALLPSPVNAQFTASGFMDTTRLASGDPGIWAAIASHNGSSIADGLDSVIHHLQDLAHMLRNGNVTAVRAFLEEARNAHGQIVDNKASSRRRVASGEDESQEPSA